MIKIGINGFGRIGRAITRIISNSKDIEVAAINDIDNDTKNLSYLLKYDTIYGKFNHNIEFKKQNIITINRKNINFYSKSLINEVPWSKHEIDLVIDASGVENNTLNSKKILGKKLSKVLITHSPDKNIDYTLIIGVNEKNYDSKKHHVISSSICDASALGPVLSQLENKFGIERGYITTLHPRLSYQNLLDGSLKSVSNPGHNWKNYSLGRDSISNLIPKKTTAVKAVTKCIKNLDGKISGMSFRVPTSIVCASDITIKLKSKTSKEIVSNHFKQLSSSKNSIFGYQEEPLVSSDHLGTSKSVIVDANFTEVIGSNLLKMIIWYDNEWGYSNRVVDIAKFVLNKR
ncbi:MAG: hypothetical protein CBD57_04075 [Candidatus Pelagibacter sp. TMED197]|nr:MAG: hypothetical protein CBD57_04075 [Candidatus Pelagibacter sp. TMED197]|tara:strand:+ start:1169 stop:2206 length:1038 start_codon:yes stop_codon:yes gene_type:complete